MNNLSLVELNDNLSPIQITLNNRNNFLQIIHHIQGGSIAWLFSKLIHRDCKVTLVFFGGGGEAKFTMQDFSCANSMQ